eukprot:gene6823-biopygen5586
MLQAIVNNERMQDLLQEQKINWRFNLSRSPWWGGFFERMVGMVKNTFRKTLGLANLTVSELQEVLLDIEFCLNNRPLTYQTDQLEDEVIDSKSLDTWQTNQANQR